jgi:hypothetical protein
MGLADNVGGFCAFLNLPEGADGTATIESKTNFFAAVQRAAGGAERPVPGEPRAHLVRRRREELHAEPSREGSGSCHLGRQLAVHGLSLAAVEP